MRYATQYEAEEAKIGFATLELIVGDPSLVPCPCGNPDCGQEAIAERCPTFRLPFFSLNMDLDTPTSAYTRRAE